MILAISRFRVANGREHDVAQAFLHRPHLVDTAAGFLGLEVFTDSQDTSLFYLATRWTDESSFRTWHRSDDHKRSHRYIPKGLKLDPTFTKVIILDRLRHASTTRPLEEIAADITPLVADYLTKTHCLHLLVAMPDGTVVAANPAVASTLKVGLEQVVGQKLWPYLVDPDAKRLQAQIASGKRDRGEHILLNLVDTAQVPHTLDCQIDVQPDGFIVLGEPRPRDEQLLEERLLQLNNELAVLARERARQAKELQQANAALAHVQDALQAALEREREARSTAEAAVLARDEFMSVAAHELRNPMASLRGFAQLLLHRLRRQGSVDPEQVRQGASTIVQQADRVTQLIDQLMDISRIEAGKLVLGRRSVDLAALVKEAVAAMQVMTSAHEFVLRAPSSINVSIDPLRFEQVIRNLLSNAVKYSPDGGRVEVEVSTPDVQRVQVTVRDFGVGIPPEQLPHIFERFYQAHGEGHLGGLGLGLHISKQIVELHGGTIQVEVPEGGGTRFVLTVPAEGCASPATSGA